MPKVKKMSSLLSGFIIVKYQHGFFLVQKHYRGSCHELNINKEALNFVKGSRIAKANESEGRQILTDLQCLLLVEIISLFFFTAWSFSHYLERI